MPVREATEQEIQAIDQSRQPVVREATPEELQQLESSPKQAPQEQGGFVSRIVKRAMGTDVDDPLELERLGTVALGAIGGSMAGSRVPPIPGPAGVFVNPITGAIAGGLTGAVGGAVAPEATLEFLEGIGILPKGAREERGLSDEELRRVVEGEALLELATGGGAAAIRATGRGVGRLATGIGKGQQEFAEQAAKQGVDVAPFQVGQRGLGRGVVNVLGRFPFLGGPARKVGEKSARAVQKITDDLPSRVSPLFSSSSIGVKIYDDSKNLVRAVSKKFEEQYGDLFLRAANEGVTITPQGTKEAGQAILESIAERTPKGSQSASRAAERVKRFVQRNITDLEDAQSLGQMDELLTKIDQEIASAPQGVKGQVARMLSPVKGAAKADIFKNTSNTAIGEEMARIDADFSQTMRELFETSTAKRFTSVERQGLRGVKAPSEAATQVPIDKLMNVAVDLESPQAVKELRRLVTPETMNAIAARTLSDSIDSAIRVTDFGVEFQPEKLSRAFGLSAGKSARKEAVQELLKDTGITGKDLETIVQAAQKLKDTPIPNASTFLARRAMIGGAGSLMRGSLPFLALTGAGAGAGGITGALGGLAFLGGGRMLVDAMSRPESARALKTVLDKEAKNVAKNAAFLRLARAGINGMEETGEIVKENAEELRNMASELANELFPEKESNK